MGQSPRAEIMGKFSKILAGGWGHSNKQCAHGAIRRPVLNTA